MRAERISRLSSPGRSQRGVLLIEALIAILIFSLGVLGMVAMSGTAIGAQSDARYRSDAARLTEDIADTIALNVDRTTDPADLRMSLDRFKHMEAGSTCAYTGSASGDTAVTSWLGRVNTLGPGLPGLPGSGADTQQILVTNTATGFNRVDITVCWRAPGSPAGSPMRHHTLSTYVN